MDDIKEAVIQKMKAETTYALIIYTINYKIYIYENLPILLDILNNI